MAEVCERYGIRLLTYGSFVRQTAPLLRTTANPSQCGGFLSEKWLGANSPDIYSESQVLTPSQRKVCVHPSFPIVGTARRASRGFNLARYSALLSFAITSVFTLGVHSIST